MGRQLIVIITAALALMGACRTACGQGQPTPHFRSRAFGRGNSLINPGRDRLYQLSPDERQAFRRNAERWIHMNPEQQKVLREREQVRRQQLQAEAEAAMQQLGLRLDPNARNQFEARYLQERRRIERELRQEVEAKRQQQLPQLNERLKSEFGAHQGPGGSGGSPTTTPSAAAKAHD